MIEDKKEKPHRCITLQLAMNTVHYFLKSDWLSCVIIKIIIKLFNSILNR